MGANTKSAHCKSSNRDVGCSRGMTDGQPPASRMNVELPYPNSLAWQREMGWKPNPTSTLIITWE